MTLRTILAVTDFSLQGGNAIARAALLCAAHDATLEMMYVAAPGEAVAPDAAERLSYHARQLRQRHKIAVHPAVRVDLTEQEVARVAWGADLVVWGTAAARGLRAWFKVHPALRMMRTCARPVVVVRERAQVPYQRVVVAVDFSQASHRLVELAFALHPSAHVEAFHAISTADEGKLRYAEVSERAIQAYREECRRHAQDRMLTLTDSYDARRNRLSSALGRGDPARQVLVQQQRTAADLIVVGKHPASPVMDLFFESIAQRVLRDACSDVLVVPHGFEPASRGSAVNRLAADLHVRRVKAGPPRPQSYPNPAALLGGNSSP